MSWNDAKAAAAAIMADAIGRDDPAAFLRFRAGNARSGVDNMDWDDRDRPRSVYACRCRPLTCRGATTRPSCSAFKKGAT